MTQPIDCLSPLNCRVIVVDRTLLQLLAITAGGTISLLRVSVAADKRVAASITEALLEQYGLNTIQLAMFPSKRANDYCVVHELITTTRPLPSFLKFCELDQLAQKDIDDEQREDIRSIINGSNVMLGRFSRLGWINELLNELGYDDDRNSWPSIRHVNQGIDFCLMSLSETNSCVKWFKAVGPPNTQEYALTISLSRQFPESLPKLLLEIPRWNGWVTENVHGEPLERLDSISSWKSAFIRLSQMQVMLSRSSTWLASVDVDRWNSIRLMECLEPFFKEAERAMEHQTSTLVRPLSSAELHSLKDGICAAISTMDDGLPHTLNHGDIGHGNILVSSEGPVFIDWAGSYVAHPFISVEHLMADFKRCNPHNAHTCGMLRQTYAHQWADYASAEVIRQSVLVAPAVAAYLHAVIAWSSSALFPDSTRAWPLIRSQLRRTRLELESAREVMA